MSDAEGYGGSGPLPPSEIEEEALGQVKSAHAAASRGFAVAAESIGRLSADPAAERTALENLAKLAGHVENKAPAAPPEHAPRHGAQRQDPNQSLADKPAQALDQTRQVGPSKATRDGPQADDTPSGEGQDGRKHFGSLFTRRPPGANHVGQSSRGD